MIYLCSARKYPASCPNTTDLSTKRQSRILNSAASPVSYTHLVYDLYAAEDITHPDCVTGVVDYSKIVDVDGNPIWHTTIRDNSGQWEMCIRDRER